MSDSVVLTIGSTRVAGFRAYSVEADLYTADDAFSLDLVNTEAEVAEGSRCRLEVNGTVELDGVIDRVVRGFGKEGTRLRVEGRDLMGLVVDSHCETFRDIQGKTVKQLAEELLAPIPFIRRSQIRYQANFVGKGKGKRKTVSTPAAGFLETPQTVSRIEPGQTVFEILSGYAASRGYMFWLEYDNGPVFVIGRPRTGGEPEFSVTVRRDGRGNNAIEGEEVRDIARRYSRITVIGQRQGQEGDAAATALNHKAVIRDPLFPIADKPLVVRMTNDSQSPALHGRLLMESQQAAGRQLVYRLPGHSQNGRNWGINRICQVRDEVLGIDDTFLVVARTFERSRDNGTCTRIRLGQKGLIA